MPVTPKDSTQPNTPVVPLTEQGIIQKALGDLPGKYLMSTSNRVFEDMAIWDYASNSVRARATDTVGYHKENHFFGFRELSYPISYYPNSNKALIMSGNTFTIDIDKDHFYNKIFINAVGDSFIAAMYARPYQSKCKNHSPLLEKHTMGNHVSDYDTLSAKSFRDFRQYNGLIADSRNYGKFFAGPQYEVQYFYNKDSLAIFRTDSVNTGANIVILPNGKQRLYDLWHFYAEYYYGKKVH